MEMTFTNSAMGLISNVTVDIYEHSRRQSERSLPDLGPFRHGLLSVKQLKAKDFFTNLLCTPIAIQLISNSSTLFKKEKKTRK